MKALPSDEERARWIVHPTWPRDPGADVEAFRAERAKEILALLAQVRAEASQEKDAEIERLKSSRASAYQHDCMEMEEAYQRMKAECDVLRMTELPQGWLAAPKAEWDALREENARLKEAAIIAGTTQANLHDVIRERDKENARLREEAALFSAQATIERLKARGNELGRDYEQKVWEVMAEIGKREAAEADAEEARAIVRDFFPKEGGEGLRALVLRTINERDALREENARLRDALKQTTEHLSVGIQESQADYQSPPEPSSQWDADAVTHVVANRALLAEPAPEKEGAK